MHATHIGLILRHYHYPMEDTRILCDWTRLTGCQQRFTLPAILHRKHHLAYVLAVDIGRMPITSHIACNPSLASADILSNAPKLYCCSKCIAPERHCCCRAILRPCLCMQNKMALDKFTSGTGSYPATHSMDGRSVIRWWQCSQHIATHADLPTCYLQLHYRVPM